MQQFDLQGMYTLKKYCAITGKLKQELGPFHNKITNIGLNQLGTSGTIISRCYVGTGTSASTNGDTNMGNYLVGVGSPVVSSSGNYNTSPRWIQATRTYRFAAGAINTNITEVGVGWGTTPSNALWSRELIVDSAGNPVTLTVLSNEYLDVVYSLRYYPVETDFTGSVVINAITYNYTGRAANIANSQYLGNSPAGPAVMTLYGGPTTLGPLNGNIVGATSSSTYTSISNGTYTANSLSRSAFTYWDLTKANLSGGITAALVSLADNSGNTNAAIVQSWQLVFDKPIPKTSVNTFGLTLRFSWGRYEGPILP